MISCRADLFKQINRVYHPASIIFALDISLPKDRQFEVDTVKFLDSKDQEDESLDGCLEWLSEMVDELFTPIKEQIQTNVATGSNVTIQQAQQWVKFMQERLSQLPRVEVAPDILNEIRPTEEPDQNGAFQVVGFYTMYVKVRENK